MSPLSPSIYRWQRDVELCWNSASKPEISSFFLGDFDNLLNFVFVKCPRDMSRVGVSLPLCITIPVFLSFVLCISPLLHGFFNEVSILWACSPQGFPLVLSKVPPHTPLHSQSVLKIVAHICSAICPQISSGL